tara:strand:- start:67 stop:516 length:450 start_codon:yes stop_codon:yes gene_type:complete
MNNYYDTLVDSGFLSKAKRQLSKAAAVIYPPEFVQASGFDELRGECVWHFDRNEKKMDFDHICRELDVFDRVTENWDFLDEQHDVIVLNAFDILIYASPNKKSIQKSIDLDFIEQGVLPYYIAKRKVNGKFLWFCMTWSMFPFQPLNEN